MITQLSQLQGREVVVSPDIAKERLRSHIQVTNEFRENFNSWLLIFFGWHCTVEDGKVFVNGDKIFMNIRTHSEFIKALNGDKE